MTRKGGIASSLAAVAGEAGAQLDEALGWVVEDVEKQVALVPRQRQQSRPQRHAALEAHRQLEVFGAPDSMEKVDQCVDVVVSDRDAPAACVRA